MTVEKVDPDIVPASSQGKTIDKETNKNTDETSANSNVDANANDNANATAIPRQCGSMLRLKRTSGSRLRARIKFSGVWLGCKAEVEVW